MYVLSEIRSSLERLQLPQITSEVKSPLLFLQVHGNILGWKGRTALNAAERSKNLSALGILAQPLNHSSAILFSSKIPWLSVLLRLHSKNRHPHPLTSLYCSWLIRWKCSLWDSKGANILLYTHSAADHNYFYTNKNEKQNQEILEAKKPSRSG